MRLALLLAWIPALALAQTTSGLTLQVQGQSSQTVSGSQCGTTVQLTWKVGVAGIPCSDLLIWASTSTCGDSPGTGDFQIADIASGTWTTQTSGTENVLVSDLPISGGGTDGGAGTGCGTATQTTINLCASVKVASYYDCSLNPQTVKASSQATIVYDALPPGVPTVTSVEGVDGALRVSVSFPSDAALVSVEYQQQGAATWTRAGDVSSDIPHLTISGLANGTTYAVRAFAQDSAGNKSAYSDVVTGIPVQTTGFWGAYQSGGGSETGGCTVGGAAGGMLAGVLALLGLLWRKR